MQPLTYEQRAHAAHCCKHGCKYGEEDCPVAGGTVMQRFPCHDLGCDEDVSPTKERGALDLVLGNAMYRTDFTLERARAELAALRAQLADAQGTIAGVQRALCLDAGKGVVNQCEHIRDSLDELHEERRNLKEQLAARTTGTALTMMAQREQEERLAQLEAAVGRLNVLVAPAPAQPGTCATCFWKNKSLVHGLLCGHDKVPFWKIPDPDSFGCIHHAPRPPGG